ncbi:amino acid ABC transporter substrate-binding protein [Xanthobacter tagetidis]|uniref:Amino acid ABC transporter substrate-binding protein n=1 Tax=Xanthobacter tagetidis TaxID=60216 RepID=A0A3L7AH97_9HYPH|nr:amino acid ABC transporter substrate-binding protein [Xanthobacter tagetidis]MBB6306655.1 general L-amino acid transport system substrate-binding protein [Xanthobacter tagetidis]RLP79031.1 amino acid ABC transporter substrate-binding protein [Xanthobacter tagetidis]
MKTILALLAGAAVALVGTNAFAQQTLKSVKDRGELVCGVSKGLPGFSAPDASGRWSGFDVDMCRAVAAAVLGDPNKVKFVPLNAEERFPALQKGDVDLLSRNSTWTLEREAKLGLLFAGISYYDGQGFLVPNARKLTSSLELDNSKVCVQAGTTAAAATEEYFKTNNMKLELVSVPNSADMVKAYDEGKCDTLTTDVSQLYALRLNMTKPADHIVLPDVISKEPLGPVVRQGDDKWFNIVKWSLFAMLNAEELGVTTANLDAALQSQKPDVKRLLGLEGKLGEELGLSNDFAARIVKAVGNYGESFERNVGASSKLGIPRGVNQLWSMGGIQYAPPIR